MPNKPIQILLVEDSPLDALLTIEVLKGGPGFQVVHRGTLQEVITGLSARPFDVALIDLGLPDSEGLATAAAIMKWGPSLPIIILTGNDDDLSARAAIQLGAQDYLVKGTIVPDLFYRAIRYAIERKKGEQALKESEAFLRRSQEIAHIGCWRFNIETGELKWSEEIFRILGMPIGVSTIPYSILRNSVHPEDRPAVDAFYFNSGEEDNGNEIVHRVLTAAGEIRVVREKRDRVDDADRDGKNWFGTFHDITAERKQESERLRLVAAMEQAAESVVITDAEGLIQYVNPFFEKTSGYTSAEAIGKKCSILKSGRQDQLFYQEMWQTLLAGRVWSGRLVNRRKDGTLYTEDCNISPVRNGGGRINNFVAVKSDVTAALALEEKYYNAQKMEAIGTLAGGIAHDFNNILTSILGYAAIAQRMIADEAPGKEELGQVIIAATRAKDLVRQILDFSRRSEQEMQPVQTHLIVREVLRLLRASIPEDIEIRHRIAAKNTTVLCNPTRFHQVVMNLCTNAYQAMPRGGRLDVRLEPVVETSALFRRFPELPPGNLLRLTVSDTGEGIEADAIKKIFDPYFSTKEMGQGTGLGLSVVHGIVSQLGGTVCVESEPERGTCFTVFLPLLDEDKVEKTETISDMVATEGGGNILYVDNEESLAVLGKKILEPYGYTVTCCSSGLDALTLFFRNPSRFDLVITDYSMPQIMGTRLIGEIRRLRPEIPTILVSGLIDRIAMESGQNLGIDAILEKPIDTELLARTVRHILS